MSWRHCYWLVCNLKTRGEKSAGRNHVTYYAKSVRIWNVCKKPVHSQWTHYYLNIHACPQSINHDEPVHSQWIHYNLNIHACPQSINHDSWNKHVQLLPIIVYRRLAVCNGIEYRASQISLTYIAVHSCGSCSITCRDHRGSHKSVREHIDARSS